MVVLYQEPCLIIKKTHDKELLKSIIFHQDIIDILSYGKNDHSLETILDDVNKQHYVFYCDDVLIGLASFLNFTHLENSPNTYFADIGIIKPYRGKIALEIAKRMLDIFYAENDVFRLLCIIKCSHSGSICFCKKLGFRVIEKENEYFLLEVKDGWRT